MGRDSARPLSRGNTLVIIVQVISETKQTNVIILDFWFSERTRLNSTGTYMMGQYSSVGSNTKKLVLQ